MSEDEKIRIYIDNSFAGKLFNPKYQEVENKFRQILQGIIEKVSENQVELLISSVFREEHDDAPEYVQKAIDQQLNRTNPISITDTDEEKNKIS